MVRLPLAPDAHAGDAPIPAERAREAGFDAHFVKPVDLNTIEAFLAGAAKRPATGPG